jgi:hypothetical protein
MPYTQTLTASIVETYPAFYQTFDDTAHLQKPKPYSSNKAICNTKPLLLTSPADDKNNNSVLCKPSKKNTGLK